MGRRPADPTNLTGSDPAQSQTEEAETTDTSTSTGTAAATATSLRTQRNVHRHQTALESTWSAYNYED